MARVERKPRLEGKVAIVTGAGSRGPGVGNGKATAVLFAREGASVLLVDAVVERAEETLAMIEAEGGVASVMAADVTSDDDCRTMVAAAVERYGRLDVLDNNVGIPKRQTVVEVSEDDWDRVMAVNVKSIMLRPSTPSRRWSGAAAARSSRRRPSPASGPTVRRPTRRRRRQ